MASQEQVHEGKAVIRSNISGERLRSFRHQAGTAQRRLAGAGQIFLLNSRNFRAVLHERLSWLLYHIYGFKIHF